MYAISYLLKQQIDHVVLDGHGQAYPKRLLKLIYLKNCWSSEVEFGPLPLGEKGSYEITTVSK